MGTVLGESIPNKVVGGILQAFWNIFKETWAWILLVLLVLAIIKLGPAYLRFFFLKKSSSLYRSREFLLTEAEKHFHESLQAGVGHLYWIYPKVRLADIVEVDPAADRSAGQSSWNRICQKHVDFVLCDPVDFRIVAVVELDDSSHNRPDRRDRDARVDNILNQCGLPIMHVRCSAKYSSQALAADLGDLISASA